MIQKIDRSSWKPFPTLGAAPKKPLPPPPARLARHFVEDPARERLVLKQYQTRGLIGPKKFGHLEQRRSPIIWGTLEDIKFYLVEGTPEAIERMDLDHEREDLWEPLRDLLKRRYDGLPAMEKHLQALAKAGQTTLLMPYLREYILTQTPGGKFVFIADDHHHSAFAWALAQETGIIKPKAAVFNVDEHRDNDYGPKLWSEGKEILQAVADCCWGSMEIANFIDFATRDQFAPLAPLVDDHQVYFVMTELNDRGIFRATEFWDSDNPIRAQQLDGWNTSLEVVDRALDRAGDRSRILSLDLDYFFRHFSPAGPTETAGFTFEEAVQRVIELGRKADFITIATSPNYFLVKDPIDTTVMLLERILSEL